MSLLRPNGFLRSQLHTPAILAKLVAKVAFLYTKKKNAFRIEYKNLKLESSKMTNVDFTTDPTLLTFTVGAVNYSLTLTDIKYVRRLRCRRYKLETNVLTVV